MRDLQRQVLIVDDEFLIAMGLKIEVEAMGLSVCGTAATADAAIELARRHRPMLVLMDLRLDGAKDGVDAAQFIYAEIGSKVIFITGSREPGSVARINTDHPYAVLFKPYPSQQLRDVINAAIDPCAV